MPTATDIDIMGLLHDPAVLTVLAVLAGAGLKTIGDAIVKRFVSLPWESKVHTAQAAAAEAQARSAEADANAARAEELALQIDGIVRTATFWEGQYGKMQEQVNRLLLKLGEADARLEQMSAELVGIKTEMSRLRIELATEQTARRQAEQREQTLILEVSDLRSNLNVLAHAGDPPG